MDGGEIVLNSIEMIDFPDIKLELARESGLLCVQDLLKVAKHGRGEKIYLMHRFPHFNRTSISRPTHRERERKWRGIIGKHTVSQILFRGTGLRARPQRILS